ncbi:MAG: sigma-54-dependent Fis family transcriptional regulator [Desulfobacteraceae bacterium]|nr:MAG: sigma-54-dependent Fis family transcriptional regulator [Desulfobacteraceae bacterium]
METNQERRFALLLVDDEPMILSTLKRVFRNFPYDLHTAENGRVALQVLKQTPIDAALVDLMMPEMNGMELLAEMRNSYPHVWVVILTGYGGVQEAVSAIQLGAVDFLQKPFEDKGLQARIEQLYRMWLLEQENRQLKEQMQFNFGFDQLIGNSAAILSLKKMIIQVAHSDASILIQGETGTGKELVARAIHHHSPRQAQSFVPVDCAGLNETVMGSELFGHVKGAFTGAHENTLGLIRSADKGTVFLDEVGELSPSMQVKLLRAIQEREVRPVGASRNYPVDVRFLAATNRNLEQEVAEGRFRQDLYYRLNVVVMSVPPLRERLEDVPVLIRHFIAETGTPSGSVRTISKEALACLMTYEWPGNVRELENVIRRAAAIGQNDCIRPSDLPDHFRNLSTCVLGAPGDAVREDSLDAYELAAIRNALAKCVGNRKKAARMLGIGEATLYRKLKRYKLSAQ